MLIVVILLVYLMYRAFSIVLSFTDMPLLKNVPRHNPDYLRKFYALDQNKRDLLFENFQDTVEDEFFKQLWTCTHSPLLVIRAKNFQDLSQSEKFDEIMMFLENLEIIVDKSTDKSLMTPMMTPKSKAPTAADSKEHDAKDSVDSLESQDEKPQTESETVEKPDSLEVQEGPEVPDLPDSPRLKKLKRSVKPKSSKKKLDLELS
jgi:hypothetical protein